MKQFIFLLYLLFTGSVVIAETMTINWYIDGEVQQTQCEVGGNVYLPSEPVKRGYDFKGWIAESFDRGTWSTWNSVPATISLYPQDIYDDRTPKEGDYMIVSDAGLYPVDPVIVEKNSATGSAYNIPIKCTVDGSETTVLYSRDSQIDICNGKIKLSCYSSNFFSFYANADMYYNGTLLHQGDLIKDVHWTNSLKLVVSSKKITGTWKFVYHGVWETDGKSGWKPEQQISGE